MLAPDAVTKLIRIPIAMPSMNEWDSMHWAAKGRLKKQFNEFVWAAVNQNPILPDKRPWAFLAGRMMFRRPNANRDIQNYEATFWKIIPDAIVTVGLIRNDTERYLRRGSLHFGVDRKLKHKGETLVVVKVPR